MCFLFSLVPIIGPFVVLSDLSIFAVLCSSEIRLFGSVCTEVPFVILIPVTCYVVDGPSF
jgi:hypothetical protein